MNKITAVIYEHILKVRSMFAQHSAVVFRGADLIDNEHHPYPAHSTWWFVVMIFFQFFCVSFLILLVNGLYEDQVGDSDW